MKGTYKQNKSNHGFIELKYASDEPITRVFRDKSLQSKEELKFWDQALYHDPIKDGVSLIVVDPNKGNQVIGMRISETKSRNQASTEEEEEPDFSKFSFYTQLVFHVLDTVGSAQVFILSGVISFEASLQAIVRMYLPLTPT